jgi:hypothetical protein
MLLSTTSRHVLTIVTLCAIGAGSAMAQTAVPEFTPVRAWSAQPTQLTEVRGLEGVRLPCVLSNEYDNGYQIRFSGGGQQLMAMAIDFRQNVFEQGRQYDAVLSIGAGYVQQVKATAFAPNTLIFNLRPLTGFYGVIKSANRMELSIQENTFQFSLAQIGASFASLESCYAGDVKTAAAEMPKVAQQTATMPQQLPAAVAANPTPSSFNDILRAMPDEQSLTQDTAQNSASNAATKPMTIAQVTPRSPSDYAAREPRISRATDVGSEWEARAGEDIRTVLGRWADRAGYDLQWDAAQNGKVAQDVALNGGFEDAVRQLLAENAAATGLTSRIDISTGSLNSATETSVYPRRNAPAAQWSAPAGANIQTVLNEWGRNAGVTIVWQSYASMPVKSPLALNGSFESAVQSLLDQFQENSERPVGQLNTDPVTGQRTLLIDIDRS